mmetsp:Transcript_17896/g.22582  ORF Transcript_17896/g.22582 Transcript_17896/m.22582 type:complete len:121 (+) Transcript_17896:104-466(+)
METAQKEGVSSNTEEKIPFFQRSLAFFLESMSGYRVVIELKNDSEVTGSIENCDNDMNLTLQNVRCVNTQGKVQKHSLMFVQGSMIRYVHIPDHVNVAHQVRRHVKRLDHCREKYKPPKR